MRLAKAEQSRLDSSAVYSILVGFYDMRYDGKRHDPEVYLKQTVKRESKSRRRGG